MPTHAVEHTATTQRCCSTCTLHTLLHSCLLQLHHFATMQLEEGAAQQGAGCARRRMLVNMAPQHNTLCSACPPHMQPCSILLQLLHFAMLRLQ